jgi:HSP20 family protein
MASYSLYRPRAAGPWGGPFDQLRRDIDALFHRYGGPSGVPGRGVYPAVNLFETPDAYVLTAELPGVAREEIHVSLEGSTVTLSGERQIDYGGDEKTSVHRRERQAGSFRRAFELPTGIDGDKVEAVHSNGVLMLRLPKTPEHRPRQISVRGD